MNICGYLVTLAIGSTKSDHFKSQMLYCKLLRTQKVLTLFFLITVPEFKILLFPLLFIGVIIAMVLEFKQPGIMLLDNPVPVSLITVFKRFADQYDCSRDLFNFHIGYKPLPPFRDYRLWIVSKIIDLQDKGSFFTFPFTREFHFSQQHFQVIVFCIDNGYVHFSIIRKTAYTMTKQEWVFSCKPDLQDRCFCGDGLVKALLRLDKAINENAISVCGNQEGAEKGFNTTKKGAKSYHPLLVFVSEIKLLHHTWFRSG
jgi:hypothetical protein